MIQHVIGGRDEVGRGVDERAVEVEDEREVVHGVFWGAGAGHARTLAVGGALSSSARHVALKPAAPHLRQNAQRSAAFCRGGCVMDKKVITLLKTQAYIDGAWVGTPQTAGDRQGDGRGDRPRSRSRRGRDQSGDRGGASRLQALVAAARQGALEDPAPLVRADHRARRRAGAAADQGAGQAARRGQGRDPLRRRLRRAVRRGGQAHLRRDDPDATRRTRASSS